MASEDHIYRFGLDRDGLHRQLAGGIPKGTIMILVGEDGTGKSAISERFIYGFVRHDIPVTVISTELTTKGFLDQMDALDYPIREDLLSKRLVFVPVFPLIGAARKRGDFLGRLIKSPILFRSDVIVIDTFSSLIKYDIDEDRAFEALSFFKKLCGQSKTIILTMDDQDLSDRVLAPFRSVSDVFIELKKEVIESNVEHLMYVTRFGTARAPVSNTIGFRIEPGAGFIVDITNVS
jgi:archaeal flagellar protein FlaH